MWERGYVNLIFSPNLAKLSNTSRRDSTTLGDIKNASFSAFLPSQKDCKALCEDFIALISRVLVLYMPELKKYSSVVSQHISHDHVMEMSQKSDIVSCARLSLSPFMILLYNY